jgi:lipid-binding SYLF domain-containing protein
LRSKGLFAGIALDGAKIMLDDDANPAVYGPSATPEQILMGQARANADVTRDMMLVAETLSRYTRPMRD